MIVALIGICVGFVCVVAGAFSTINRLEREIINRDNDMHERVRRLEKLPHNCPHHNQMRGLNGGVFCADCDHELLPLDPKDAP